MPDAKRPDPKRRSPASRPGKPGESGRGRPRGASPVQREPRALPRGTSEQPEATEAEKPAAVEPIRAAIAEAAEQQSEQRLGSAARRAAILAAVICVLTLTIAGPVRTYFAQRTEMQQLETMQAQLRSQIADLEQQKVKLADPVFIAAQARERLGFVMPGEIPYQVQLPATAGPEAAPGTDAAPIPTGQPWYTSLWHTIADTPHGPPPAPPVPDPAAPAAPGASPLPAPPPGG
ncbi:septum formation initiator family protein [Mycolicibacterium sp. P9-64]|uniref:FtsB family cell division protein n=1 Tax=Mycolicibacterium sp. P9-64 TaxID=2024612 RepID=UPI0011EFCB28|nr:septum formation initiator family protein [Mycolicibacterium sp. P9-64]KAA0080517.1 septum formation initiator family protein [Mycolicibacterium sp. P9-64]